jgi:hypothetical protein
VTRSDEWQLDEVAQGGCSCDAVDPNEPAGFGTFCVDGDGACSAPLECLAIDPVPSPGPFVEARRVCTQRCSVDADCPRWDATGFCAGPVELRCSRGSCQPRACD